MARARLDDGVADGLTVRRYLKLEAEAQTLGAAVTITNESGVIQAYDAGGSSRNVTLPVRAAVNDGVVRYFLNLSTAGENLVIKLATATTILTLPSGGAAMVIGTGTAEAPGTRSWMAVPMGGEDLAISDDLVLTGDLTVNGAAAIGNAGADVIGFHGKTPVAQAATFSLVTAATIATVINRVQSIITALKNKGLVASS